MMSVARAVCFVLIVGRASAQAPAPAGPTYDEWKDAKADVAAEAAAAKANEAKMAAVNKVIQLLEDLRSQVLFEGESEAKTYNEFACFCRDKSAEKTDAIQTGEDEQTALASSIGTYSSERDGMDTTIQTLTDDIATAEQTMKTAEAERAGTLKTYQTNEADLRGAISALEGAIDSLKSSKQVSLVQLRGVAENIRTATTLADALGLASGKSIASFVQQAPAFVQQAPEVAMEDYKFHSGDIIETLENLLKDFRDEKADVDASEVESVRLHDLLMQQQTDLKKAKELDLKDTQKAKALKVEEIAMANAQLTTVSATLLDDKQYLSELSELCSNKAQTWDQRSKVRQDELSALTAAIGVVKNQVKGNTSSASMRLAQQGVSVHLAEVKALNPRTMEAIEAEAEAVDAASPLAFFQRASRRKGFLAASKRAAGVAPQDAQAGRAKIVDLLRSTGNKLKSTLLTSLANQISSAGGSKEDPLAKVKILIQELIERLLQEASNESNQKDWCDKATSEAEQKRDYAAKAVEEHNAAMAMLEGTRDKLTEEIGVLTQELSELNASRADAVQMRADEKAESQATIQEAQAGLAAVESAIQIIDRFYKTVAKETVEYSLAQQGPLDDAPDAGFDNGEAYTGAQGEAGGIIGMMEVIRSDFERTIAETEKAEMQAEQDHLKYMTESGISVKQKMVASNEKTKQNTDTLEALEGESDSLSEQMDILSSSIQELLELKPVCVDTGMSYEERVKLREEEIAALKKALCILEAYAEYGPDGLADAC